MREWLEPDGLGGFASGTATGVRTRRYHAILLTATTPPTGRIVLINGADVWVDFPDGRSEALSTNCYAPGVIHPDGQTRISSFTIEPWPTWTFRLSDGTQIVQELFVQPEAALTFLRWRVASGSSDVKLRVRPFMSGRDYHALHHENSAFDFAPQIEGAAARWRPYTGLPAITCASNGAYVHQPEWFRTFLYEAERERGLDDVEDLASPGAFEFQLQSADAVLALTAGDGLDLPDAGAVKALFDSARECELRRRSGFATMLDRAADAYIVRRNGGRTIVAGYPWFTDWGRDTFIALRGVCLATGRLEEARDILLEWSGTVSEGMLPNRFPDGGSVPEFNAVDASLWFIVAAHELMELCDPDGQAFQPAEAADILTESDRARLRAAIEQILEGYSSGTRFGIRADADGLLQAGEPGVQLTWMDAKIGDWVVTPRTGKPVEIQALWLNGLWIAGQWAPRWQSMFSHAYASFLDRFWNWEQGCLYDVVDVDHVAGAVDATCRPNQIFAVGGLPLMLLDEERARAVVDCVEARLLTPYGLRSLAPGEQGYTGRYEGDSRQRDAAYHQGAVWPWLMGAFLEAWVRVRGGGDETTREARARFLSPLLQHLDDAGLDHVSEILDGDSPHAPKGCPFQAWSVGELIRVERVVLSSPARADAVRSYV